jgi:hypothetical protein
MNRIARACIAVLLPVQLAGCYGYAAMREPPAPGEPLRARLTPGGAAWLVENFGRNRENVDGTFVRQDDASVVFTTWRADLPNSAQFRTSIDTLYIPREHVAALEQRQLSIARTAIAAALGAGIVALAVSELSGAGGSDNGNGGGTPLLVLPLRLPFAH